MIASLMRIKTSKEGNVAKVRITQLLSEHLCIFKMQRPAKRVLQIVFL